MSVPDGSLTPALPSSAIFDSLPSDAASALEIYKRKDSSKGKK